jgi:hypothetical protein
MTINHLLRTRRVVEKHFSALPDGVKGRSKIHVIRQYKGEDLAFIETFQQKPSGGRTGKVKIETDHVLRY